MDKLYLAIPLAPLAGSIIAGLFGRQVGRAGAHWAAIAGVSVAFLLSVIAFLHIIFGGGEVYDETLYVWLTSGAFSIQVGFLIDSLTVTMMVVVTCVSLMVHIYTIGYMRDDPGYQRFFSYISLFTFSMLMLVMANNFMQLFFGWEAVGLVSYLLIGFWFKKPTAIHANLKAFLVNRVGDFGFLLGIGAVLAFAGSLDYAQVFAIAPALADETIVILGDNEWSLMTVTCVLLFIGAMGKSAQIPLHVWLPDSMEGPTPISALIHAATMVTAGIFMVARMSPLFELSETALSVVLVIGASTALLMGLMGLVQHDIKRVIAYSTLSQLGYMTVALGASAYSAAIFHLMTHAFFQGVAVLGCGLGDYRPASRAGYTPHGGAEVLYAGHLLGIFNRLPGANRRPRICRVFLQGCDYRSGAPRRYSGCWICVFLSINRRIYNGIVQLPPVFSGLSWRHTHG